MTNRGQWIIVAVILGVLGGALIVGMGVAPSLQPVGVESPAPSFTAIRVASGDTVSLEAYRGEVVLLNIWATWCAPCEAEMPSMQRLYEEFAPLGLKIVAVSVDDAGPEHVRRWVEARGLTFEILQDRAGRIERAYQTSGVPESFVIDRRGTIVKKVIGPAEWDHPTQKALFRALLARGVD